MIRRLALGAAGTLLVGGLATGTALAQEAIDSGEWEGSEITSVTDVTTDPGTSELRGVFIRSYGFGQPRIGATVTPPSGLAEGCAHQDPWTTDAGVTPDGGSPLNSRAYRFDANVGFGPQACNGEYRVEVVADVFGADDPTLTTTIDVAIPPEPVDGVRAEASGRSVEVSWTPTAAPAPDFRGYQVVRSQAGGEAVSFDVDPDATSFTDTELPAEGGTFEYQVVGRRPGPGGGDLTGSGGHADAPVEVEPSHEPGGDGQPGDDADGGPGTTVGGGAPGSRSSGGLRAPSRGRGGNATVPPPGPPTTADTGYDETLPFGDAEPGAEDPVLPNDELASTIFDEQPGRGLAVPVATGLVLAVWAFHLRHLARAAKPE